MKRHALVVAAIALSSCSHGASGGVLPPASPQSTPTSAPAGTSHGSATFTIAVPAKQSTSATSRSHPLYVSPNTGSLSISVIAVNGQSQTIPATVAPIAYGASGCTSDQSQPLSCTVAANVPSGNNVTFRVNTYASSNGTGSVLSTATLTKTITANAVNTIPITLGGVVNSVALSPTTIHTVGDGQTHTYPVALEALDASGATIVGGSPFASPISISVSNDPNGAVLVSQTSVTAPGAPFQLRYNGAKHLDDAQIRVSAGSSGSAVAQVIPFNVNISNLAAPMGGQAKTVTLSEVGFTGSFTASVDDPALATTSVSATSNGQATLSLTPAPLGGTDGMGVVTISDGTLNSSINIHITAPPLPSIQEYPLGDSQFAPFKLTALPSGSLFFSNGQFKTTLGIFNTASHTVTSLPLTIPGQSFFSTGGVATDASGNVWVGASFVPAICEVMMPSQTENCYTTGLPSGALIYGVAAGPDGNIWFTVTNFSGSSGIANVNPSTGNITFYTTGMNSGAQPYSIVAGSDGNMWFTDVNNNAPAIGTFNMASKNITEYTNGLSSYNPATGVSNQPYYLASAPGKLYVSDAAGFIGTFVISTQAFTESSTGLQRNASPGTIIPGPDGKLWFDDMSFLGDPLIGSLDPSTGAVQEYSSPASYDIRSMAYTSGSDLWFTDLNGNAIGHITAP